MSRINPKDMEYYHDGSGVECDGDYCHNCPFDPATYAGKTNKLLSPCDSLAAQYLAGIVVWLDEEWYEVEQ